MKAGMLHAKTPNSTRMRVNVRDSFWFLPMIYGIFSIISVILMTIADFYLLPLIQDFVPNIVLTNQDIASSLYSALITAILTMTTISFSTIMVVLTTYTTQFSPRTLQDFMKTASPSTFWVSIHSDSFSHC